MEWVLSLYSHHNTTNNKIQDILYKFRKSQISIAIQNGRMQLRKKRNTYTVLIVVKSWLKVPSFAIKHGVGLDEVTAEQIREVIFG